MMQNDRAALSAYDPTWPRTASHWLLTVEELLSDVPGADAAFYDHIGSTSVAGLSAKPLIDLQVRIVPLPSDELLIRQLTQAGFQRAVGARSDSPGVYRDTPRGPAVADDSVWMKSLFVHAGAGLILHVRRTDSPWGEYTVWFRDWLRAHPADRDRYEAVKRALAEGERGKADYDDYTRAKTAYFDEVQGRFERWALERDRSPGSTVR